MTRAVGLAAVALVAVLLLPASGATVASDLAISMRATPEQIEAHDSLTYTIKVTNNTDESTFSRITVTDALPSQVGLKSVTTSSFQCSSSGNNVTCTVATLRAGQTASVDIQVNDLVDGPITFG